MRKSCSELKRQLLAMPMAIHVDRMSVDVSPLGAINTSIIPPHPYLKAHYATKTGLFTLTVPWAATLYFNGKTYTARQAGVIATFSVALGYDPTSFTDEFAAPA